MGVFWFGFKDKIGVSLKKFNDYVKLQNVLNNEIQSNIQSNTNLINNNTNLINNNTNLINNNTNLINNNTNLINHNSVLITQVINSLKSSSIVKYVGEYSSDSTYSLGDVVSSNNNMYISKQNDNVGNDVNNTQYWYLISNFSINLEEYYTKLQVDDLFIKKSNFIKFYKNEIKLFNTRQDFLDLNLGLIENQDYEVLNANKILYNVNGIIDVEQYNLNDSNTTQHLKPFYLSGSNRGKFTNAKLGINGWNVAEWGGNASVSTWYGNAYFAHFINLENANIDYQEVFMIRFLRNINY